MMLEEILEYVKQNLSEERANHILRTTEMCEKLANIYGVDVEKAKLVGAAHDIAKEFSKEQILKYIEENSIEIDEIEKENLGLLHGKIGADIVKKKYGFDEEMAKAIEYHTTGCENMSLLAKVLFAADALEEGRTYSDVEETRQIAYENLDEAIISILNMKILKSIQKGRLFHEDTVKARNYILMH